MDKSKSIQNTEIKVLRKSKTSAAVLLLILFEYNNTFFYLLYTSISLVWFCLSDRTQSSVYQSIHTLVFMLCVFISRPTLPIRAEHRKIIFTWETICEYHPGRRDVPNITSVCSQLMGPVSCLSLCCECSDTHTRTLAPTLWIAISPHV